MCVGAKKIKRRMRTGWKGFVYMYLSMYLSIRFYLRDEDHRYVCMYALRGQSRGGRVVCTFHQKMEARFGIASGIDGVKL